MTPRHDAPACARRQAGVFLAPNLEKIVAKVPSDSDLKSRYSLPALPEGAIDQGNLKKLKRVQGKVLEMAKEARELLPDDGVSKKPLLAGLDTYLSVAVQVFRTRSAGGEVGPAKPKAPKLAVTPRAPKLPETPKIVSLQPLTIEPPVPPEPPANENPPSDPPAA